MQSSVLVFSLVNISEAHERISRTSGRLRQEYNIRLARACVGDIETVVCVDKVLGARHIILHVGNSHLHTT
jgi:hypothetical protein